MNSQSSSRNLKPKGFKVKLAFQIGLLLAFCLWLLYQVKYSQGKNSEPHGSYVLGRKGNAGVAGLKDANVVAESVGEEDGISGETGVLSTSAEEKIEEESFRKEDDNADGNRESREGNEIEKETVSQYKELKDTVDNADIEVEGNDEPGKLNENSLPKENSQEGHQDRQANVSDEDGEENVKTSDHEVEGDKEHKTQVNPDKKENEKDQEEDPKRLEASSTTKDISVHQEPVNDAEVHGFDDVNGVPLGGNDIIESVVTGSSGDHTIHGHQETNSSLINQSETDEKSVNEEVVSKEGIHDADFEAKSRISVEDSKTEMKQKVETSLEIGGHADTSRSGLVSENTQRSSSVSDF